MLLYLEQLFSLKGRNNKAILFRNPHQGFFIFHEQFVSFGMKGLKKTFCTFMPALAVVYLTDTCSLVSAS